MINQLIFWRCWDFCKYSMIRPKEEGGIRFCQQKKEWKKEQEEEEEIGWKK